MPPQKRALILAVACVSANAILGLWAFSRHPERERLLFLALFLPVLWVLIELGQGGREPRRRSIMTFHRSVFAATGLLLAVKASLRLAHDSGLLQDAGVPLAMRCVGILSGFLLMIWGNYLPKLLSPWDHEEQPFDWQRVHRAAGWLAIVSGSVTILGWLTLSLAAAKVTMAAAFVSFAVITVTAKFRSLATYPQQRAPENR